MTNSTNTPQKSSCCASHTFWTWLLAILLAIYLFWQWQQGLGPANSADCCGASVVSHPTDATVAAPIAQSASPFSFTASNAHGYNATGDASNVAWAAKSAELSDWFKGGSDWVISGDASHIKLEGTVDSEEIKQNKGAEAEAFFGTGVTVDNQLTVKASEPATTAPSAVKLFFDTGKTSLPADANQSLAATIDWLKANSTAKAVISGYSDPRGNLSQNEMLSKNRAKAVRELLKSSGIDETRIEMRKPEAVESGGDLSEARRVEVSVE